MIASPASGKASRARVAVDAIPLLSPLTGVGNYTDQLVRQLPSLSPDFDYFYYYGYFSRRILRGSDPIYRLKNLLFRLPGFKKGLRRAVEALARGDRIGFDLYFEPNFIPLEIRAKRVVTTVHDFSFKLFPETHPRERIEHFQKRFFRNVDRSDKIITDSLYVKTEAAEFLQIPPETIVPIHLGIDHSVFNLRGKGAVDDCRREFGLPDKFILFVGTREPRKNLDGLFRAYLELPERIKREFKLVLVGPRGWGEAFSGVVEARIRRHVVVIDYVDTDRLASIYNLATLFVFPSLYEGFGLPPLEAMACGCPVVASKVASLPEVCGEAAYYVEPGDPSSIGEGIRKVLEDTEMRKTLISKGIEQAGSFSWERTARETLAVFREVLAN